MKKIAVAIVLVIIIGAIAAFAYLQFFRPREYKGGDLTATIPRGWKITEVENGFKAEGLDGASIQVNVLSRTWVPDEDMYLPLENMVNYIRETGFPDYSKIGDQATKICGENAHRFEWSYTSQGIEARVIWIVTAKGASWYLIQGMTVMPLYNEFTSVFNKFLGELRFVS